MALGPILAAPFITSGGVMSIRWLAPAFLMLGFLAFVPHAQERQVDLATPHKGHT
jgi:hypothetical protein